jgi:hypothetical protein
VFVNPQATWPLLPTTRIGRPGSVTPVMRSFANAIDARYQMIGTPIARCMSLAIIAAPEAECAAATAQLLLPMIESAS